MSPNPQKCHLSLAGASDKPNSAASKGRSEWPLTDGPQSQLEQPVTSLVRPGPTGVAVTVRCTLGDWVR